MLSMVNFWLIAVPGGVEEKNLHRFTTVLTSYLEKINQTTKQKNPCVPDISTHHFKPSWLHRPFLLSTLVVKDSSVSVGTCFRYSTSNLLLESEVSLFGPLSYALTVAFRI